MNCPNCGSDNITNSHRRGVERGLRYLIPWVPYRCKECWSRFWKFQNPFRSTAGKVAGGLVVLIVFWIWLNPLERFAPGPDEPPPPEPLPQSEAPAPDTPEPPDFRPSSTGDLASAPQADGSDIVETDLGPTPSASESDGQEAPSGEVVAEAPDAPAVREPAPSAERPAGAGERPLDSDTPAGKSDPDQPAEAESPELKRVQPGTEKTHKQPRLVETAKKGSRAFKGVARTPAVGEFRMTVRADGPVIRYNAFTLESPPRLVVNLPGKWENQGRATYPMDSDLVDRVRVGEHPDYLSIVLDLKGKAPASPTIEKTDNGFSLTLKK